MVKQVAISSDVQDYAVRVVLATHPDEDISTPKVKKLTQDQFIHLMNLQLLIKVGFINLLKKKI